MKKVILLLIFVLLLSPLVVASEDCSFWCKFGKFWLGDAELRENVVGEATVVNNNPNSGSEPRTPATSTPPTYIFTWISDGVQKRGSISDFDEDTGEKKILRLDVNAQVPSSSASFNLFSEPVEDDEFDNLVPREIDIPSKQNNPFATITKGSTTYSNDGTYMDYGGERLLVYGNNKDNEKFIFYNNKWREVAQNTLNYWRFKTKEDRLVTNPEAARVSDGLKATDATDLDTSIALKIKKSTPKPTITPISKDTIETSIDSKVEEATNARKELSTARSELNKFEKDLQDIRNNKVLKPGEKVTQIKNKEKEIKKQKEKIEGLEENLETKEDEAIDLGNQIDSEGQLSDEEKKTQGDLAYAERDTARANAETAKGTLSTANKALLQAKQKQATATDVLTKIDKSKGPLLDTQGKRLGVARESGQNDEEYKAAIKKAANNAKNINTEDDAQKEAQEANDKAQGELHSAELNYKVWNEAVGQIISAGETTAFALSFLREAPTFPALSNALFGSSDNFHKWQKGVDETFAELYLVDKFFVDPICNDEYKIPPGEAVVRVQTGKNTYQFVGSLQAEKSATKSHVMSCDEFENEEGKQKKCPNDFVCKASLCYQDEDSTEPELGYMYKISWAVTAPSDQSQTLYQDENRQEIDFNLRIDENWIFRNEFGQGNRNTVHLERGKSSKSLEGFPSVIVEIHPNIFNEVCIEFGDNKPKDWTGNGVGNQCAPFKDIAIESVNFGNTFNTDGTRTGETKSSPKYCGLDGQC